ncbi:ubiquinone biosynthesis protein [Stackebrandtia endophytica]|uniref:Ubiquinone biosynthesis protein n=1 Tax=Stackebrandtia endophytica TaxID=1496996 RepID=A0A543AZK5_9ACTN|nr:ubiquinone biosynthesis protein [Stackebrandtia endophytica]
MNYQIPDSAELVLSAAFLTFTLVCSMLFVKGIARMMGLRVGLLRAALCSFGGISVGGIVVGPMMLNEDANQTSVVLFFLGVVFIGIMLLLAISEVFAARSGGLITIGHSQYRRVRRTWRYSQITGILVRHGLGGFLSGRKGPTGSSQEALAVSARLAMEQAGVTFVKLGQVLSTRRDLFGPEVIAELSKLQDDVAPVPWQLIEPQLTGDLGLTVKEAFASFDTEPIASASIAQVYRATLHSGDEVVVKVRRPQIKQQVERDLDILKRLAATLERRAIWARRIGVRDLADGFADALREELDFRIEARNLATVAAAGGTRPGPVVLPKAYQQLSSERVLVMQFLDGSTIGRGSLAARGVDAERLARSLLHCLLRQILVDGVFHADPHPGNILLMSDDRLALIDYGSVGRIDTGLQTSLQHVLLAIDQRDPAALHDGLMDIMERTDEVDTDGLERSLGRFMARHLNPGVAPDAEMFTDLFRLVSQHGIALPREIAAVFRALATVEGTLTDLAPDFHIVEEAKAFASREFAALLAPESLKDAAGDELRAMLPTLRRIPRRIERITAALEHGRLSANIRLFADPRDRAVMSGYLGKALLTILSATTGIMSVMLLDSQSGPRLGVDIRLYQVFGYMLLVVSIVLMVRVLVGVFRKEE